MAEKFDVGLVGGGQLGRMLTEAALPLGLSVAALEKSADCPAVLAGAIHIPGESLYDRDALGTLVRNSRVTTLEIEHTDAHRLEGLAETSDVQPSPRSLAIIQDKHAQHQHLSQNNIPVAPYHPLRSAEQLEILGRMGKPLIIKNRFNAYDGRGNMFWNGESWNEVVVRLTKGFGEPSLYAEEVVPFSKELSGLVARGKDGSIAQYPIVETVHKNNICHMVISPAPIDPLVSERASKLALKTVETFEGAGVFAVEMFLTEDGEVLVNEVAPRVHNSGHHTIEGNKTSQFEQHLRAILGLRLGSTAITSPAVMINILGEREGPVQYEGLGSLLELGDVHPHIYGKKPTKVERKMGHITVLADSTAEATILALEARKRVNI